MGVGVAVEGRCVEWLNSRLHNFIHLIKLRKLKKVEIKIRGVQSGVMLITIIESFAIFSCKKICGSAVKFKQSFTTKFCLLKHFYTIWYEYLPKIATTSSSCITSKEPVTMKHNESIDSPVWYKRSPGAECDIVKCIAKALKHPSEANRNAGCSLKTFLFKWTQMSAFMSFGQKLRTWKWIIKGRWVDTRWRFVGGFQFLKSSKVSIETNWKEKSRFYFFCTVKTLQKKVFTRSFISSSTFLQIAVSCLKEK